MRRKMKRCNLLQILQ